jgi:methylthioribose-1-phosphate isomerase
VAYLDCVGWREVAAAIASLAVRGAPAVGLAGAYGVALAAREASGRASGGRTAGPAEVEEAAAALRAVRPTAVNLGWAVDRTLAAWRRGGPEAAAAAAVGLHAEDRDRCEAIAAVGAPLLREGSRVLTVCHTGALATGGCGTALGIIARAHREGRLERLFVCETRPHLQGARLTMWECGQLGIPATLIVDAAAAHVMRTAGVTAVLAGADRIAANGDVANKIGTYALAVLARHHGRPFYVAAPGSTFDAETPDGGAVVVEERDAEEVRGQAAPAGCDVSNPVFDVTPASLVTAYITERGVKEEAAACWT